MSSLTGLTKHQIGFLFTLKKEGGQVAHIPGARVAAARKMSAEGIHQTAASLVRRGLIEKTSIRRRSCYRMTTEALALLQREIQINGEPL